MSAAKVDFILASNPVAPTIFSFLPVWKLQLRKNSSHTIRITGSMKGSANFQT